jgi:GT2 family glycosyltransferase
MEETEQRPLVSVIIVNWNTYAELRLCLEALHGQRAVPLEVIVVDNNSSDGSVQNVRREFPSVRLIANQENLGFAEGCNQGLRVSRGRYMLLLNPDTVPNSEAIHAMVRFLESNQSAGAVGCQLVLPDGTTQITYSGFPNVWNYVVLHSLVSPIVVGMRGVWRKVRQQLGMRERAAAPRRVGWLMGACLMVRQEVIDQVGLLDNEFFMYCEDTDWCKRMHDGGWEIFYLPSATIAHLHQRSSRQRKFATLVQLFVSLRTYYLKHKSANNLRLLTVMVTIDMVCRLVLLALARTITLDQSEVNRERHRAVREILRHYWHPRSSER